MSASYKTCCGVWKNFIVAFGENHQVLIERLHIMPKEESNIIIYNSVDGRASVEEKVMFRETNLFADW